MVGLRRVGDDREKLGETAGSTAPCRRSAGRNGGGHRCGEKQRRAWEGRCVVRGRLERKDANGWGERKKKARDECGSCMSMCVN
jgi:hypothetical protein